MAIKRAHGNRVCTGKETRLHFLDPESGMLPSVPPRPGGRRGRQTDRRGQSRLSLGSQRSELCLPACRSAEIEAGHIATSWPDRERAVLVALEKQVNKYTDFLAPET